MRLSTPRRILLTFGGMLMAASSAVAGDGKAVYDTTCVACHATTPTGSVSAGPGDFCVACHRYAAVKVDCFECHTGKPRTLAQGAPK